MLPVAQSEDLKVSTVHLHQAIVKIRVENGETGIRANDFIARVADELDGDDYETFVVQNANKTESIHFMITMDQAKLVAMRESKTVRKIVLERLREYESNNRPKLLLPDFSDPVAAARAWADAKESEIKAIQYAEAARPAVAFVERYVQSTGNLGFRQVCKMLKANEKEFRAFLKDFKIMYKLGGSWSPYTCHIVLGRFHVTTGTSDNEHNYTAAKFTPKGVEWISALWSKYQNSNRKLAEQ